MEDKEIKKIDQVLWDLKILEISIEKELQDLENGIHQGKESKIWDKCPCEIVK